MYPSSLLEVAERVLAAARQRRLRLVTAESLTAGLIAGALASIPGASDVLEGGFVTYSYAQKVVSLGVDRAELERTGAVTASIARQMALGALAGSAAEVAVAVTGVAGPGPSGATPAGTVCLALARRDATGGAPPTVVVETLHLPGDRMAVRMATVAAALERIDAALRSDEHRARAVM